MSKGLKNMKCDAVLVDISFASLVANLLDNDTPLDKSITL